MAIEKEMSPLERGATVQGFGGKEIPPEAAEKILDVLDKTIDQFLAAKRGQQLEEDRPTMVLEDGTREWRNEAGLFHREKGPAVEFSDGRLLYFQNGAFHREDGPAVINTDGSRLYFLNDKQVPEREIMPARVQENGTKEWRNEAGELHREHGPAVDRVDGTQEWYQNGVRSREDGPAIIDPNVRNVWYKNGNIHREDGPALENADGGKAWYREGFLHREDGPAIERANGEKEWYREGVLHRENGPAIEYEDGSKEYYLNGELVPDYEVMPIILPDGTKEWHNEAGQLHRENGPAIVYEDGSKEYYQNELLHREDGPARVEITDNVAVSYAEYRIRGELHREDGPAIERDTGEKEYYRKGKLHREDGPAIERADGTKEYYLNGKKTTAAELVNKLGLKTIDSTPLTEKRAEVLLSMAEEARRDTQVPANIQIRFNDPVKPGISTERIQQANAFMDRPIPQGAGAAREYCVEARKAIALNGQWPGETADENIAKKLLQQGHDKSKIIEAIRGKSPEMIGRDLSEARAYAKALVDRSLTPEIKKERQRSASRER